MASSKKTPTPVNPLERSRRLQIKVISAPIVSIGPRPHLAPRNHWLNLGAKSVAAGDFEGAAEAYDQALAWLPSRADLFAELGNVRQELNDPDAALALLSPCGEVDPDNISALQNLGYLLCKLGEPEQASNSTIICWKGLAVTDEPDAGGHRAAGDLRHGRPTSQAWRQRFASG